MDECVANRVRPTLGAGLGGSKREDLEKNGERLEHT